MHPSPDQPAHYTVSVRKGQIECGLRIAEWGMRVLCFRRLSDPKLRLTQHSKGAPFPTRNSPISSLLSASHFRAFAPFALSRWRSLPGLSTFHFPLSTTREQHLTEIPHSVLRKMASKSSYNYGSTKSILAAAGSSYLAHGIRLLGEFRFSAKRTRAQRERGGISFCGKNTLRGARSPVALPDDVAGPLVGPALRRRTRRRMRRGSGFVGFRLHAAVVLEVLADAV